MCNSSSQSRSFSIAAAGVVGLCLAATADARPVLNAYQGTGYRISVVAHGDGAGFEAPGFDDSGFVDASGAFGSGGGCPLQATVATGWPVDTDLLVRYSFHLDPGATGLIVGASFDNDIQVFLNGTDISGGVVVHELCPALDDSVFTPADGLLVNGTNVLAFRVIDRGGESFFDARVEIASVGTPNSPPECPSTPPVLSLWPPDHEMVAIDLSTVVAATDPDGDTLTYSTVSITQDEPLNGRGDGNTGCDSAGGGTGLPEVRRERQGPEDGRVYVISYAVSDGNGGECSGTVIVGVPHDRGGHPVAIDSGQAFDSTACLARDDVDGNGIVGFGDVAQVLTDFGTSNWPDGDADLNDVVEFADIVSVLTNWGQQ